MGRQRGSEEYYSGRDRGNWCLIYLDMITELLRVLNYFKVNVSYDSMLDCSLYELDYWIARANKFVEEEEERQNKEN